MMIIALMVASTQAHAWEHLGMLWPDEDIPIEWWTSSTNDVPADGVHIIEGAFDAWVDAVPCAELGGSYEGTHESSHATNDGRVTVYWDDPLDQFDAGINAVTLSNCFISGYTEMYNRNYVYRCDGDIVFNDHITWATAEEIESGDCTDGVFMEGVAAHEVGHLFGLGHSCEAYFGTPCDDALLLDATMYFASTPCSRHKATPNEDDIRGMNALYGHYLTYEVLGPDIGSDVIGAVPLEISYEVSPDTQTIEQIDSVTWDFGDGDTSSDLVGSHTYHEQGQYSVTVSVEGGAATCGGWNDSEAFVDVVRACGVPRPMADDDGVPYDTLAGFDPIDAMRFQLINYVDLSVQGCVSDAVWEVRRDGRTTATVEAWAPILDLSEDVHGEGEGLYEIELTVRGMAGEASRTLTIEAGETAERDGKGCGCASSGRGGGVAVPVLLALVAVSLRRTRGRVWPG